MPDKDDVIEPMILKREDGSFLVSGFTPIESISELIGGFEVDFEKIDYSTIAGLVLSETKGMPRIGDSLLFSNHLIEILDMDGHKIDKLLIRKV